jgi:hypothetical protein
MGCCLERSPPTVKADLGLSIPDCGRGNCGRLHIGRQKKQLSLSCLFLCASWNKWWKLTEEEERGFFIVLRGGYFPRAVQSWNF